MKNQKLIYSILRNKDSELIHDIMINDMLSEINIKDLQTIPINKIDEPENKEGK